MSYAWIISDAQEAKPDGFINNGGTSGLVASVGEPVTGLLRDGSQHCLQGFVYKIISGDFNTGTEEYPELNISIQAYPNPSPGYLYLEVKDSYYKQFAFSIYSLNGTLLKSGVLSEPRTKISLQAMVPATYLVVLENTTTSQLIYKTKIVKL